MYLVGKNEKKNQFPLLFHVIHSVHIWKMLQLCTIITTIFEAFLNF